MSVERTLERVARDLAAGDLGKARDRLHGLIAARPADLDLRRRLGSVYWELRHPSMAGRYWFLEEDKSPEMAAAVRAFERECGGNPVSMLRALKFRGDVDALDSPFAREALRGLQRRAGSEYGFRYVFGLAGGRGAGPRGPGKETLADKLSSLGCLLALALAAALMIIGLVTVVRSMFYSG